MCWDSKIQKKEEIVASLFKEELISVTERLSKEEDLGKDLSGIGANLDLEKTVKTIIEVRLDLRKKKNL